MDVLVKSAKLTNKNTDSKGRVTLGARFASRTVIIQEISDTELLVQLARVIPENALGLHARGGPGTGDVRQHATAKVRGWNEVDAVEQALAMLAKPPVAEER